MIKFIKSLFGPATDFKMLIEQGAVIVDVRSPGEFQSGHIRGSVNIPVDRIEGQAKQLKKDGRIIITCCQSSMRSKLAKNILQRHEIEVYNGGSWSGLRNKIQN